MKGGCSTEVTVKQGLIELFREAHRHFVCSRGGGFLGGCRDAVSLYVVTLLLLLRPLLLLLSLLLLRLPCRRL